MVAAQGATTTLLVMGLTSLLLVSQVAASFSAPQQSSTSLPEQGQQGPPMHPNPMDLKQFNSVITSNVNLEYAGSEELFAAAAQHEWSKHNAATEAVVSRNRKLQAKTTTSRGQRQQQPQQQQQEEAVPTFPYVVCSHTPGTDGHTRSGAIASYFSEENTELVHNHDDKTCFLVQSTHAVAVSAAHDVTLSPLTPIMKFGRGGLAQMLKNVEKYSSGFR